VERYTFASQLSVLRNAPTVMSRLMKKEGAYLLSAKILVISRLLHKALSQAKNKPPIVDQLWEKLLSMRRRLLRRIDKRLASTTGEAASLVESMCAFALATSSAPSDVLQHFHKVRLDKMASELKRRDEELAKHGISALKICIQTCLDTQTIFPRRLAEALTKLKAHPVIQDQDIRGLYELNLDVHDRWLGDEARNYTPWPRHDELQRPEAEKILHRWSKDAIVAFLKGIKKALEGEGRLKEVANLRQELIETWILSGSRMAGVKATNVLDDLRDTMNEKLESIVRDRTRALQVVMSQLTTQLDDNFTSAKATKLSLWSTTANSLDISNGAETFKSTILHTYQGRDQHVNGLTSAFDKWMNSVLEVKGIVKSMKEARWDDTFADDVDDDSDDDLGDSKQTLLSDDDPRLLEEVTQEALAEALQSLGSTFAKMADSSVKGSNSDSIHKAVFILRVVREIGDRISRLKLQDRSAALASPFTPKTLETLYRILAANVASPTTQGYSASLSSASKITSNNHILWEGNPPLPGQPSPSVFRFLRDLNTSMAALGSDLWAPACVAVLKGRVADEVLKIIEEHVSLNKADTITSDSTTKTNEDDENASDTAVNGDSDSKEIPPTISNAPELHERRLKQLVFDTLYIQRFMATPDDGKDKLVEWMQRADVSDILDGAAMTRLKKNASDYARKTYLLFALLA
jgi:polyhydroxyalkanoate synthesis regulator phasin